MLVLLHLWTLALVLIPIQGQLKLNAFNIQIFGKSKMEDPIVVGHLVDIITQYDLILIQEIRDADEVAIYELLAECNAATSDPYSIEMSERLGRTSSTEQYAFFYRHSKFSVARTFQWDANRDDDVFERPPFVVEFTALDAAVGDFGFIPIHAKPDDAVAEIDALVDVYDGMVEMWGHESMSGNDTVAEIDALVDAYDGMVETWGHENFILGGDFNAACDYVGDDDWVNIRLRNDDRFDWIIADDVNTRTRTDYTCAYDRLVLAGSNLQGAFIPGTNAAYRFDDDFNLTEEEALEVSDHVPVVMDVN